jgi:hypothetical protein
VGCGKREPELFVVPQHNKRAGGEGTSNQHFRSPPTWSVCLEFIVVLPATTEAQHDTCTMRLLLVVDWPRQKGATFSMDHLVPLQKKKKKSASRSHHDNRSLSSSFSWEQRITIRPFQSQSGRLSSFGSCVGSSRKMDQTCEHNLGATSRPDLGGSDPVLDGSIMYIPSTSCQCRTQPKVLGHTIIADTTRLAIDRDGTI